MRFTSILNATVVLVLGACGNTAKRNATAFADVVKQPATYDGRTVAVTGLAYVTPNRFYLTENGHSAAKLEFESTIIIQQRGNGPFDTKFNNRWVTVRGVVHALPHESLGGFRCAITKDSAQILPNPPEKQWKSDAGWFRNDTANTVELALLTAKGVYAKYRLDPGDYVPIVIRDGAIFRLSIQNRGTKIQRPLPVPARTKQASEPADRIFYYSIDENGLRAVPAQQGRKWILAKLPPS
jgi:hypothetical protein